MQSVSKQMSMLALCAASVLLTTVACNTGKDAKQLEQDSIYAKIKADSITAAQNTSSSSNDHIYTAGLGKINPAKKNGKGQVILQDDKAMDDSYANMAIEMDQQGIYSRAEVKPTYPGGETALAKFIQENIIYPEPALENGVEANVNVVFAVDENGKVYTPTIKGERMGYGLDEAATNVVGKMPKWNPGKIKGKNVKSYYNLPITFKID